jgi:hypothetical protein
MRALVFALCVACIPVAAETPEAAQGEVVSFTRGQLEQFLRQLEAMVSKREAAAFEAGRQDTKAKCRSLI